MEDNLLIHFIKKGGRVDGTRSGIIIGSLCRWLYYRQQCDHWQRFVIPSRLVSNLDGTNVGEDPLEGMLGGFCIIDSNQNVHSLKGRWIRGMSKEGGG